MPDNRLEFEGTVTKACGNGLFSIFVKELDKAIVCNLSGKMKVNNIKVIENDRVKVSVCPYTLNKGTITYRAK